MKALSLLVKCHTLKQQVAEYVVEEAMKEQAKIDESLAIDAQRRLLLNPDTDFGERFEAVMTDSLKGRHTAKISPEDRYVP